MTLVQTPKPSPIESRAAFLEQQPGYRLCTRCVMDTTDPDIVFDDDGVCNHCHAYEQRAGAELFSPEEGERRLQAVAERIRQEGKGKAYDCIIGVSGGVDSTMVAYTVKRVGLRPLAVHLDNGWNSELAVTNIKKTLDTLEIPLYTHVIDWEEFRDLHLSFLKASVPNIEIPSDHGINAILFKLAAKQGARFILTGGNVATEAIMPVAWTYYNLDLKHLRAVHKQFGTAKLRTFPQLSLTRYAYEVFVRKVRIVSPLNFIGYKKSDAIELLQRELGWTYYGGKHYESIITRFYQGYILPVKFGYDKRKPHYSCLIHSGDLTREQALEELKHDTYATDLLKTDREFVLKKFELTEQQFAELMSAPIKRHTDYPSHDLFFQRMEGLKQAFKRYAKKV